MYVQSIYWQDFTLDFRDIRWTFGRAWDWTNFPESHEKFVRFGNSAEWPSTDMPLWSNVKSMQKTKEICQLGQKYLCK